MNNLGKKGLKAHMRKKQTAISTGVYPMSWYLREKQFENICDIKEVFENILWSEI